MAPARRSPTPFPAPGKRANAKKQTAKSATSSLAQVYTPNAASNGTPAASSSSREDIFAPPPQEPIQSIGATLSEAAASTTSSNGWTGYVDRATLPNSNIHAQLQAAMEPDSPEEPETQKAASQTEGPSTVYEASTRRSKRRWVEKKPEIVVPDSPPAVTWDGDTAYPAVLESLRGSSAGSASVAASAAGGSPSLDATELKKQYERRQAERDARKQAMDEGRAGSSVSLDAEGIVANSVASDYAREHEGHRVRKQTRQQKWNKAFAKIHQKALRGVRSTSPSLDGEGIVANSVVSDLAKEHDEARAQRAQRKQQWDDAERLGKAPESPPAVTWDGDTAYERARQEARSSPSLAAGSIVANSVASGLAQKHDANRAQREERQKAGKVYKGIHQYARSTPSLDDAGIVGNSVASEYGREHDRRRANREERRRQWDDAERLGKAPESPPAVTWDGDTAMEALRAERAAHSAASQAARSTAAASEAPAVDNEVELVGEAPPSPPAVTWDGDTAREDLRARRATRSAASQKAQSTAAAEESPAELQKRRSGWDNFDNQADDELRVRVQELKADDALESIETPHPRTESAQGRLVDDGSAPLFANVDDDSDFERASGEEPEDTRSFKGIRDSVELAQSRSQGSPSQTPVDDVVELEEETPAPREKTPTPPPTRATTSRGKKRKAVSKSSTPAPAPASSSQKKRRTGETRHPSADVEFQVQDPQETRRATLKRKVSVVSEAEEIEQPQPRKKSRAGPAPKKAPGRRGKAKKGVATKQPAEPVSATVVLNAPETKFSVFVSGANAQGQLGMSHVKTVTQPTLNNNLLKNQAGVVQVAAGKAHCIALTHDNKVLTWGQNADGQLGRTTTGIQEHGEFGTDQTPIEVDFSVSGVPEGTTFVQVVATDTASFVLTQNGQVYGWGTFREQYTNPATEMRPEEEVEEVIGFRSKVLCQRIPVLMRELKNIKRLATGAQHVLALKVDEKRKNPKTTLYSWGANRRNQLGRKISPRKCREPSSLRPGPCGYLSSQNLENIGAGAYHSFAVETDGEVYAWGYNRYGQTGIQEDWLEADSTIAVPSAVDLLSVQHATAITGGKNHSLAIAASGECLSWGSISHQALGVRKEDMARDDIVLANGSKVLSIPTQIGLSNGTFSHISSGEAHSIAVSQGIAYGWGSNNEGQLQSPKSKVVDLPSQIGMKGQVVDVVTGGDFSVFLVN